MDLNILSLLKNPDSSLVPLSLGTSHFRVLLRHRHSISIQSCYIRRIPFSHTRIFIHVFKDYRCLLRGPWKMFLSTLLYEVIVSTTNSVIYPSRIISIQKYTTLDTRLLVLFSHWNNWRFHSISSSPWKLFLWVVNFENHPYNTIGNLEKKILWIFV